MAIPAVSYARDVAPGLPGMIATTEPHWITSMIVGAASGDIPFGRGVVYGAAVDTVILPTAGGTFAGVAVIDRTLPATNNGVYKPYDQIGCLKNGSIWVTALAAVAQGGPVYMTPTGEFTSASTGNALIANAEWATVTAGAGIARIRFNVSR